MVSIEGLQLGESILGFHSDKPACVNTSAATTLISAHYRESREKNFLLSTTGLLPLTISPIQPVYDCLLVYAVFVSLDCGSWMADTGAA